jgi:5-keto 4-deoxyuronate isomerase
MRLFSEISRALTEEGISPGRVQYTVIDGKGGYFQNVKRLLEFSDTAIVLTGKKGAVRVEGEKLSIGKYYAGDATVLGDIRRVERVD